MDTPHTHRTEAERLLAYLNSQDALFERPEDRLAIANRALAHAILGDENNAFPDTYGR
jgi:hypothetical protein